jgi:hypothetical protein
LAPTAITSSKYPTHSLISPTNKPLNNPFSSNPCLLSNMAVPVHRLSDDVLLEIFSSVTDSEDLGQYELARMPVNRRPWVLSPWNCAATCQRWRSICLSNPGLWTRISTKRHVCNEKADLCVNGLDLRRCYIQLQRSGSLPLSVDGTSFASCHCTISVIQAAAFQSHRWKSFTFYPPYSADNAALAHLSQVLLGINDFSQLLSFRYGCSPDCPETFLLPFQNPGDLISLRHLELVYWGGNMEPISAPGFPWGRLQSVNLHDYMGGVNQLLSLFQECKSLVSFRFYRSEYDSKVDDTLKSRPPDSIVLDHLAHLEIVEQECTNFLSQLLPFIRTPSLRSIRLDPIHCLDDEANALTSLIERSQCRVTTLFLRHPQAPSWPDIIPFFKSLVYLEELCIRGRYFHHPSQALSCDDVLRALLRSDGPSLFLPRLRHLNIAGIRFDAALLVEVVKTRSHSLHPEVGHRIKSIIPMELLEVSLYRAHKPMHEFYKTAIRDGLCDTVGIRLVFDYSAFSPIFDCICDFFA